MRDEINKQFCDVQIYNQVSGTKLAFKHVEVNCVQMPILSAKRALSKIQHASSANITIFTELPPS